MPKNAKLAHRLREWMGKQYGSVNAFALALDVSQPSASQYLNGARVPGNKMQSRLRDLGCDIEWLMTGVSNKDYVPPEIELVSIKILDYPGKQPHSTVREPVVEYIHTENKGDDTKYGIVVRGDKMMPELRDGEIVIASKIARTKKTDLAIVTLRDGEIVIARIYPQPKQLMCRYDNAAFPPRIIPEKDIDRIDRIVEKITRY